MARVTYAMYHLPTPCGTPQYEQQKSTVLLF